MNRFDALKILGIGPEATLDEARRAYREQVKLWHPDRYSDGSALKSMALKNAQDANRAWAFLRTRLPQSPPPRPHAKTFRHPPQDRQERQTGKKPGNVIHYLRRLVDRVAPLVGRIRKMRIAGIVDWLRDDPGRRYRPWYRYSRETSERHPKSGASTFRQTLADVMETRRSGSLNHTARAGRKSPPAQGGSTPARCREKSDQGHPGVVDLVDRSRET